MPRQRLPLLTSVKPDAAWQIRRAGQRFRCRQMQRQKISGRARWAWRQLREIAKGSFQRIKQSGNRGVTFRQHSAQTGKPGGGSWPTQAALFQSARCLKPSAAFQPRRAEWMLQHREQSGGREAIGNHARDQAEKRGCRCVGQRRASAIIRGDAMPREFGRYAPRQIAIWRDQRCALAGCLHSLTQQQRNGGGFLLCISGFLAAHACQRGLPAWRVAFRPNLQPLGGAQTAREQNGAIRWC